MSLSATLPFSPSAEDDPDSELMRRVREGDREAFGALVERHKDALVGYLSRLTGDRSRAEDLAQEAFLRLYRAARSYREEGRLAGFLFRIATNLLRSEERRARRWRLLTPRLVASPGPAAPCPQTELLQRETARQLQKALEALPLTFRAPLVLFEIEGWSYRAIAETLSCREGTVKSRIARARSRLRPVLAHLWNGDPR